MPNYETDIAYELQSHENEATQAQVQFESSYAYPHLFRWKLKPENALKT